MQVIIARYGEIHLKGGNRGFFIKALKRNIEKKLNGDATVNINNGRIIVTPNHIAPPNDDGLAASIASRLQEVFGLTSISIGEQIIYTSPDDIINYVKKIKPTGTFKVEVNRADKTFPIKSPEFAAACGAVIQGKVDVINPANVISVDIREDNIALIFSNTMRGLGGLPVGVSGRALCLISGGIDSPVAAYLSAKRGLSADFIHFASPPYTNEQSLDKVKTLCNLLAKYTDGGRLFVIPFTKNQQEIRRLCREDFTITLMRRQMIAIAEKVGLSNYCDCIITGENLAQVASQTIQGIASNNFVATKLPILRPLICCDKEEIIAAAKKIGTYETSILPYPDCCTVFVPDRPSIKPKLPEVEKEEQKLNFTKLCGDAITNLQIFPLK
jgi:thiamine biosynthesis protein ThiI